MTAATSAALSAIAAVDRRLADARGGGDGLHGHPREPALREQRERRGLDRVIDRRVHGARHAENVTLRPRYVIRTRRRDTTAPARQTSANGPIGGTCMTISALAPSAISAPPGSAGRAQRQHGRGDRHGPGERADGVRSTPGSPESQCVGDALDALDVARRGEHAGGDAGQRPPTPCRRRRRRAARPARPLPAAVQAPQQGPDDRRHRREQHRRPDVHGQPGRRVRARRRRRSRRPSGAPSAAPRTPAATTGHCADGADAARVADGGASLRGQRLLAATPRAVARLAAPSRTAGGETRGSRTATSTAPASATAAAAVSPIPSASVNARPGGRGQLLPGRPAERGGLAVSRADRLAARPGVPRMSPE